MYSLQCYIRRSRPYLERYLSDLQGRLPVRVAPDYDDWISEVREIIARGDLIFPGGGNPYLPWTVEVLLLRILEEMYTSLGYAMRLSTLLPAHFPSEQWPIMTRLLQWISTVEGYTTVDALEIDYPLEPEYFSVMRQPVQFFGSQETALIYGKGENQLYVFQPSRYLRLLDISDPVTVKELTGVGYPFSSFTPHSSSIIQQYTEVSLDHYRASALTHHLLNFYSADEDRQYAIANKYNNIRNDLAEKYKWQRYRVLEESDAWNDASATERWELLLGGQSYEDMLMKELLLAVRERPNAYQWIVAKYGTDDNYELVGNIQEEFPEEKVLNGHPSRFVFRTFEGYLDKVESETYESEEREKGKWLVGAVTAGNNFLGAKEGIDFLEVWIQEHNSYWGGVHGFIFNGLGLKYFDYFTTEIASPRGDWTLSQWRLLYPTKEDKARFSTYIQDTMIVYSLTTSPFFNREKIDGWWCTVPAEIMLYRPADKGEMRKTTGIYNTAKCVYSGAETEENFLDEYT